MKITKRIVLCVITVSLIMCLLACDNSATMQNIEDTKVVTETLTQKQGTPTDITFSLERYNLLKRAYWVNGQEEKALMLPCDVVRPIGYIALISGSTVLCTSTVDGKVSSLNSYLSPDSEYYEVSGSMKNRWLADVDGSYGSNTDGIFWFTTDGHYHEWNGQYLYSDVPFEIDTPVLKVQEVLE